QRTYAEMLRAAAEAQAASLGEESEEQDLDVAVTTEMQARQAATDAYKAQQAADAKAAELSRSRGDYGAVASLRTTWDFKDLDKPRIDLEPLPHSLATADIEKAVRHFIRDGGRELRGVTIYENTTTQVR